jgi:hypothetical protein
VLALCAAPRDTTPPTHTVTDMSLIDLVHQELGSNGINDISQQLGVDPATAQRAVSSAIPMMLGGMANTAQQPGGEGALQSAMGALGGSGGLGDILGGASGGLGGILGSILGQHHTSVQGGVEEASGLDAGKAGKLLMILAPFIIRALAKHQETPAAQQSGGLGGSLQEAAREAANRPGAGGLGGVLGNILGGLGR